MESLKSVICVSDGHFQKRWIFWLLKKKMLYDMCHMIALVSLAMPGTKPNSCKKFPEIVPVRHVLPTSSTSFVYSLVNL